MKRVEIATAMFAPLLQGAEVLEVACGCAEFSICAASLAKNVHCIDLDTQRLPTEVLSAGNIHFSIMDAAKLDYSNACFDVVVLYNAIGHLTSVLEDVISECKRVLRFNGKICIISSSKLDSNVIHFDLLPILQKLSLCYEKTHNGPFDVLTIH